MKKARFLPVVLLFVTVIAAGILNCGAVRSSASGSWDDEIQKIIEKYVGTSAATRSASSFTQFHDPDAPRVVDRAGILSESFENSIKSKIAEYSARYRMDFVVLTVDGYSPSEFGQSVIDFYNAGNWGCEFGDYVSDFYDYNGYGIGSSFNGIIFGINMEEDNHEYWFSTTGDAIAVFEPEIPGLKRKIQPILSKGDYEKAVSTFLDFSADVAERLLASMLYDFGDVPKQLSDLVYDNAGVLSSDTKKAVFTKLADVRKVFGSDCMIEVIGQSFGPEEFEEDVAAYYNERGTGYTIDDYAADTFHSKGFGIGDTEDGAIVVLSLGIHNELAGVGCYSSGKAFKYYLNKAGEIREFLKNDATPDEIVTSCAYYLDLVTDYEENGLLPVIRAGESDPARRVIDGAGIIQDSFEEKLVKKLDKLVKKYKMDFVVLTTYGCDVREFGRDRVVANNHGFYGEVYDGYDYGRDYFKYYGYGLDGDDPSGLILVIDSNPENPGYYVSAIGKAEERFTESRVEKLEAAVETTLPSSLSENGKSTAVNRSLNKYVRYIRSFMVLRHYPLSVLSVIAVILVSFVIALIINSIVIADRTPAPAPEPGVSYIPADGVNIRGKNEVFIRTDTTRTVVVSSSSGGGSRGGGGFSHGGGSSGVSHGGGGGRF
ncbi:MAG: TPM domain-containing protein [Clostridia bacterium]|nr:TPM domain-containing protein [Clostridia bacterium]